MAMEIVYDKDGTSVAVVADSFGNTTVTVQVDRGKVSRANINSNRAEIYVEKIPFHDIEELELQPTSPRGKMRRAAQQR